MSDPAALRQLMIVDPAGVKKTRVRKPKKPKKAAATTGVAGALPVNKKKKAPAGKQGVTLPANVAQELLIVLLQERKKKKK